MSTTLKTKARRKTRGSSTSAELAPTLGPLVCRWIEANCVLGEGDWYGQPVKLRPFQRLILYLLYELNPDGSRKYRRALIGMPKGAGKSPLAAWIASAELAGPVVFAGWDAQGRPMGIRRTSPVVPVGAASFEQADLVFGEMKVTWKESPTLAGLAEVFDTEILLKDSPGKAYRIAAARATNDGGRPSCFVADELHEWNTPAQAGAHLVMANGTAKRADSLQLAITTAGADLDTLLGRMYLEGKRVESGELNDPTYLFIWHEAPDDVDTTDDDAVRAAIRAANPAADDYVDVDSVLAQFRTVPEFEGRRYFLNQWTRAGESWLPPGVWDSCAGAADLVKGRPTFVGIDMALRHDSVAVVAAQLDDNGIVNVSPRIWTLDGTAVDIASVELHLRQLHRDLDVVEFDYDPAYFEMLAQVLADDGLPMIEFPQSRQRMVPACQLTYELIVGGMLRHPGHATLTDHVLSAAQRSTDQGWSLSKGRSRRKIDGCIAMVIAVARVMARLSPASVYEEERGLLVL